MAMLYAINFVLKAFDQFEVFFVCVYLLLHFQLKVFKGKVVAARKIDAF